MSSRSGIPLLLVFLVTSAISSAVLASDENPKTTVALTATVPVKADKSERDLMGTLLSLLDAEVSAQEKLLVVERRQIDLVLHEMALSADLAQNAASRLQLGKIAAADLILTLERTPSDNAAEPPRILIRIVESLTGIIRGVSVAAVDESQIDEAAAQIARYLALVESAPKNTPITVAVAPFESKGRFDRLRPLERGLRDMITTRLRKWSDTLADEHREKQVDSIRGFQVLQRSSMQELLRELELIQSGLADPQRLPPTLPTRAAAFLVHGSVDEQNENGVFRIVVEGQLVHAATGLAVREFRFVSTPDELQPQLAHQVDLLVGFLRKPDGSVSELPGRLREFNETQTLFQQVVLDLRRFARRIPIDFSTRGFELPRTPGKRVSGPSVHADSTLGMHLLHKSIDRLEVALFIAPDRADVCYALGFCYSFHLNGIADFDRADELLRRAFGADPNGPVGAAALRLLAEVCYHHQKGHVDPTRYELAASQSVYAFRSMPTEYRDRRWSRLPKLTQDAYLKVKNVVGFAAALNDVLDAAETAPEKHQYYLARAAVSMTVALSGMGNRNSNDAPPQAAAAQSTLLKWANGDRMALRQVASRYLGQMAYGRKDFEGAAKWYLHGAEAVRDSTEKQDVVLYDNFRVNAADGLRRAGKTAEALKLLQSFRPVSEGSVAGYWAIQLGSCYEDLGEPKQALAVYIKLADTDETAINNTDVVRRIQRLGGVPLSPHREIDVHFAKNPGGGIASPQFLATDGHLIFCAGNIASMNAARGIAAFDPDRETWQNLSPVGMGRVTCLDYFEGTLWVGTTSSGLWRGDVSGTQWKQYSVADGLPDASISTVTADPSGVYAGVGSKSAGGVVRIMPDHSVEVFEGDGAPRVAPMDIVIHDGEMFVATGSVIYARNRESRTWQRVATGSVCRVFKGTTGVWATCYSHELFRMSELRQAIADHNIKTKRDVAASVSLRALSMDNSQYQAAWFPQGTGRSGYLVKFAVEWGGDVWFGGSPWYRFQSAGLYRCNMQTGKFTMFTPHDGFRTSTTYMTYDAVVRGDELWVATSAGLAKVTMRDGQR